MEENAPPDSGWWNEVSDQYKNTTTEGEHFWQEPQTSIEIEVALPETKRGMRETVQDFANYMVTQLKRRAVEISEKRLTAEEAKQFAEAKGIV